MAKRPYDSAWRQAQARQTREALLDAARRRFLADGFAATTVAVIAADVGVSVDTIYKAFGGKPGLVRAICADALAGEGPVPAETRSDALHGSETDPRALIRGWGVLAGEVAPRVVPILLSSVLPPQPIPTRPSCKPHRTATAPDGMPHHP